MNAEALYSDRSKKENQKGGNDVHSDKKKTKHESVISNHEELEPCLLGKFSEELQERIVYYSQLLI